MAHKGWLVAALAGIALATWLGWHIFAGTAVAVDTVRRGNLVETVVASGHVETPYRVEIASQITGTVANIPVREGQRVTAGQLLVTLDTHELDSAVVLQYLLMLVDKKIGHIVPTRFVLFALVGGTGVAVHMATLALLLVSSGSFRLSQAAATRSLL